MTKIPSPPFLDSTYLELTLGWPRSHQRKFVDWIRKEAAPGHALLFDDKLKFYGGLFGLLSLPGGYLEYENALRSFDSLSAKRGLYGKIAAKVPGRSDISLNGPKVPKESAAEKIERLCADGHLDVCAEYAWSSMLLWAGVPKHSWPEATQLLLSAIESQGEGLAYKLGDFLSYLSGDSESVVAEPTPHLKSPSDEVVEFDHDALSEAWTSVRHALSDLLDGAPVADINVAKNVGELAGELLKIAKDLVALQDDSVRAEMVDALLTTSRVLAEKADLVKTCRFDLDTFESCLDWSSFNLEGREEAWIISANDLILDLDLALGQAIGALEIKKQATQAYDQDKIDLDDLTSADQDWKKAKRAYEKLVSEVSMHRGSAFRTLEIFEVAEPVETSSVHDDVEQYPSEFYTQSDGNELGSSEELPEASEENQSDGTTPSLAGLENVEKGEIQPEEIIGLAGLIEVVAEEIKPDDYFSNEFKALVEPDSSVFLAQSEDKLKKLLYGRRLSLAREVSRASTAAHPNLIVIAPTVIFDALSIGDAVRGVSTLSASNAFDQLQEPLFEVLQKDAETDEAAATQLMGFAAALRPALFSPHGSASAIVRWGAYHDALYELGQFAGELSTRLGRPLTTADLAPWRNKQNRMEEALRITQTLLNWAETAPKQTLKFARATQIWASLFKNSPVSLALDLIRQGSKDAVKASTTAAAWLAEDGLLKRLDDHHREISRDKPLEAGSRTRLLSKMEDAAGQLEAWVIAHIAAGGTERNQHIANQTDELRRHLETAAKKIKSAVTDDDNVKAALSVVEGTIKELILAFDGQAADATLSLEQRLNDEPLLALDVPYKYGQSFVWSSASAKAFVASFNPDTLPTFEEAFRGLIMQQRFEAAGHILGRLASEGAHVEDKWTELDQSFEIAKNELERKFDKLRRQVDVLLGADNTNQIDPSLSNRLDTLVSNLTSNIDGARAPRDLAELSTLADLLQEEIAFAFEILVDPLRTEIATLQADGHDVSQLTSMADRWDLATLSEHLEAAKDGHTPASSTVSSGVLSEYVTAMIRESDFAELNLTEFRRALDQAEQWGRFDLRTMNTDERSGARRLLGAWIGLRSDMYEEQTNDAARRLALIHLFQELGFTNVRIAQSSSPGAAKAYSVRVDPLDKREYCAVTAFGSECKGTYNIVLVDPKRLPQGEDLFSVLQRARAPGSANILMVLGNLSPVRRNQFLHSARKEATGAATALIDESVVLFLAARAKRRLSDFFDLTIPQGAAQPYNDKATQTSPEMFFGRQHELSQLLNPNGSCLVYGGRQLGKTALLKQLQLQHHKPPHQYVLYNSYDDIGEGRTYPVEELWKRVGESMVNGQLTASKPINRKQVEEQILEFLAKNPLSRIIILIDEADYILKSEIQSEYPNIVPIKTRLMEPTNYRCKFVFAGLHNVQRTARSPNSPLLHFGKAIQIGPLYQSDIRAAWEMVERPMSAVGYVFDDRSLIGRILSQVGYYPSFVQSLCTALIHRLDKRTARAGVENMPIAITGDDIDDATGDETFNGGLQHKFEATLELDERYRLITYVLLVDGFRDRELGTLTTGHSDVEVQRLALSWWPEGFADDQSLDAFQGLLEEMVGLGVLVRQTNGKYMIRSSRIAAMLGGSDAISQKILELVNKPRPLMLDAGNIRRLSKEDDRVSPLTDRQESMLLSNPNPIHIAVGSTALGLEWLAPNLERLSEGLEPDEKFQTFRKNYSNSRDLLKCVEAAASDAQRGRSRRNLAWVVATGPWPDSETMQRLSDHPSIVLARRGRSGGVRVILVPNSVEWRDDGQAIAEGLVNGAAILPLATMGESGLQHWLMTMSMDPTPRATDADTEELKRLTGGFPRYLWDLKKAAKTAHILDMASKSRDKRLGDSRTLREIGLDHSDLRRAAEGIYDLKGVDVDLLATLGIHDPQAAVLQLQRLGVLETVRSGPGKVDLALNPFVSDLIRSLLHVAA
ncbi:hypothetical protein [Rhizobium ruizarguesonis]|uniref:hypothetical protein n=1 Tax=Rhizobium ruizarguesonis TaxID=2081791 RepID=UPI0013DF856B|nr:hypothetical protein [Rhizobium ruizarguesonis]NEJ95410.1 hypothetical protein [Rhizobium ruizarguesonis]